MSVFDPDDYPYMFHTWTMTQNFGEKSEDNPRLNAKKPGNVLKIKFEIDGKYSDNLQKGRHLLIEYLNYEGEKHYAKVKDGMLNGAPTFRNWQRRYQWIIKQFPDTEFYHVEPFEGKSPPRMIGFDNLH